MEIICRICQKYEGEFFTLDSEVTVNDTKLELLIIFNECLHLEASTEDLLPQVVCSDCLVTLKLFYQFLLRAYKSNEDLIMHHVNYNDDVCSESQESVEYSLSNPNTIPDSPFEYSPEKDHTAILEETEVIGDRTVLSTAENAIQMDEIISRTQDGPKCSLSCEPLIESRKFACLECGRKYSTEVKLEKHRQLHSLNHECQCQVCDAVFYSSFEHSEHMKTHCEERKFVCEFCNKAFMSRASLQSHILTHYNIKPFKCEVCGKEFRQKSILKTHMTLHIGKPIECEICQKRFSRTAYLNIHMRLHNKIRPYACDRCPNNYMQKSHLDRHIASSHMGARYQCTLCDRIYTNNTSLSVHVREEHSNTITLYECEICKMEFTKQKSLYYHQRTKHSEMELQSTKT